jgi:competence protein ComGC
MKKTHVLFCAATIALFGCLALFNSGCGKNGSPSGNSGLPAATVVSAEKTSFAEVTGQLDPGGNFFLYLGTAQWLEHLAAKVENWHQNFTNLPDLTLENTANLNRVFGLVNHLITDSGIEDISGMGMSSVEIEKGLYRNKMLLHHYPGTGTGFLWKLCGKEPHALTGLDLLPTNTALAAFSDMDLPLLWTVAQDEATRSDFPQAREFLQNLPDQFEQKTGLKWDAVLDSLGGECGFVLTLDESNNIPIPLAGSAMMIPEPGLLLVLKVNDDTIFNRIDQQLKANQQVISVDRAGLKMRTMPAPLPFLSMLRPTAASSGGYLFIASSDALVNEVLAVKSGKFPGLKTTDEFKRLSQNIPDQGNQFTFMSERFGRVLFQIQQQAMDAQSARGGAAAQPPWLKEFFRSRPAFAYSIGMNTSQGCLGIGNGSASYANMALLPAVAVPAMLSAIAIPNFVKAREKSQQNACINNLRMIDAAKNQWALENNKKTGDPCTADGLKPYIRLTNGQIPKCPAGGTYTIGAIGESPKCSIPGHLLR